MATLFNLTSEMQSIEDALIENGGELTPEIETALTETKESLIAKVDNYNALINKFKASSDACANEIKRVQGIKKTCDNAEKRLKEHILAIMQEFGIERLEGDLCKMYPRKSEKVETNDDLLLQSYQTAIHELEDTLPTWMSVEVKINKTELKKSIKEGVTPVGSAIVDNYSLIVK